ncbi:MAG TPA: AAA family ATPase, partial [Candidatus Saccharibacteria bacterium]|nr:AAA family ATPase [Candidatus Saccharibacteria bacterium]
MSQALYRKYRSRSFDEIVGQKGVVTALSHSLKRKQMSHAYLFTGPRGVGKTSIARIFAYAINDVPYNDEELPVDIIEIDAASNRGIEQVRDLREKVRIAPIVGPYKVYIID